MLEHHLFVIGYHSISPADRSPWHHTYAPLSIDRDRFEAQIDLLLRRGHSFIAASAVTSALPPKPTVIFFDDGFRDILTTAAPILEARALPATVFPTTGLIDRTHLLFSMRARLAGLAEHRIRQLKKRPLDEREAALAGARTNPADLDVFLDWNDLRRLAAAGFEIGAHGVSHLPLPECGPDRAEVEIGESAARVERELGVRPTAFSYPHGRYDGRTVDAVRRAGFKVAVGGRTGLNPQETIEGRRLFLRKIQPSPRDSLTRFALRLYLEGPLR